MFGETLGAVIIVCMIATILIPLVTAIIRRNNYAILFLTIAALFFLMIAFDGPSKLFVIIIPMWILGVVAQIKG